jgi:hypothetical protein
VSLRNLINPLTQNNFSSQCVLDSGASRHFFGDISLFTSLDTTHKETFLMASSQVVISEGTGTVILRVGEQKIKLSNVAYYSKATTNLISLSYLEDHHGLYFNAKKRQLQSPNKIVCFPFVRSLSSFVLRVSPLCVSGGAHTHISGGDAQSSGGAFSLSGGAGCPVSGAPAALSGRFALTSGAHIAVKTATVAVPSTASRPTYSQVLRQSSTKATK